MMIRAGRELARRVPPPLCLTVSGLVVLSESSDAQAGEHLRAALPVHKHLLSIVAPLLFRAFIDRFLALLSPIKLVNSAFCEINACRMSSSSSSYESEMHNRLVLT